MYLFHFLHTYYCATCFGIHFIHVITFIYEHNRIHWILLMLNKIAYLWWNSSMTNFPSILHTSLLTFIWIYCFSQVWQLHLFDHLSSFFLSFILSPLPTLSLPSPFHCLLTFSPFPTFISPSTFFLPNPQVSHGWVFLHQKWTVCFPYNNQNIVLL